MHTQPGPWLKMVASFTQSLVIQVIYRKKHGIDKQQDKWNWSGYCVCSQHEQELDVTVPGGWLFLTLWHRGNQREQHTSWCLCLPVGTLQTVEIQNVRKHSIHCRVHIPLSGVIQKNSWHCSKIHHQHSGAWVKIQYVFLPSISSKWRTF